MDKLLLTLLCSCFCIWSNAQKAYYGEGDQKFQVGANLQSNGSGVMASYDIGIGDNISVGLVSGYILGVDEEIGASFDNRFDLKVRFNANIGDVINIDEALDFYPGLHLGLKNFGGHFGTRYFFSDGFGVFSEFTVPLAKYKTGELTIAEELHNQFTFNIGVSFDL